MSTDHILSADEAKLNAEIIRIVEKINAACIGESAASVMSALAYVLCSGIINHSESSREESFASFVAYARKALDLGNVN